MVPSPNPLVAARHDSTDAWDGFGLAEDIRDLAHGISAGNWVDLAIGGFAASMDALAFVTDPLGSLASWGVAWLIEHVKPLSDALDWLAGDPDQIAAFAQTWRNVAGAASSAAAALRDAVARDLAAWSGAAADAYRQHVTSQASALGATSDAACTIALITEASGLVVALVRNLVRDLIAEFVSILAVRLWEWLAEEACTLGIATPWVAAQVSALIGKWVAKIAKLLKGLASTVKRLAMEAGDLGQFIERVRELLKRSGKAADDVTHGGTRVDGGSPNVPGTHGTSDDPPSPALPSHHQGSQARMLARQAMRLRRATPRPAARASQAERLRSLRLVLSPAPPGGVLFGSLTAGTTSTRSVALAASRNQTPWCSRARTLRATWMRFAGGKLPGTALGAATSLTVAHTALNTVAQSFRTADQDSSN